MDKDGKLLGVEIEFVIDGGAYTTLSPVVLSRGTIPVEENISSAALLRPPWSASILFANPSTAGVDALNLRVHVPGVGVDDAREQIRRLGADVVPRVKEALT